MKVKCLNNSSKKTKEMIRKEFANLLAEKKEFNKVTVTELVKNIGITRGSFYSHYDSLDEVAKEFQNEALDVLREDINSISDIEYFLDKINLFLKENNNLYSSVLKTNDAMIFMERLNKLANTKLVEILSSKYTYKDLALDVSVFVDGIVNLYIKYFRGEIDFNLDEINDYSKKLFKTIFKAKDLS